MPRRKGRQSFKDYESGKPQRTKSKREFTSDVEYMRGSEDFRKSKGKQWSNVSRGMLPGTRTYKDSRFTNAMGTGYVKYNINVTGSEQYVLSRYMNAVYNAANGHGDQQLVGFRADYIIDVNGRKHRLIKDPEVIRAWNNSMHRWYRKHGRDFNSELFESDVQP